MNKSKLLSIIIPAYNAEKYVLDCLRSLKGFMSDGSEIIVINDGSNDNTEDLVKEYSQIDPRVRLITIANGGVSKARNTGLDVALGKYIMFLDADDYLLDSAFEIVESLIVRNDYDFVAFSRMIVEEDGETRDDEFALFENNTQSKDILDSIMYADSKFNECWGKLYKKNLIDKYNIRFPVGVPIGEDMMFVMEYYSHCEKRYATNMSLVGYRQHGGSAMRKYGISDRLGYAQDLYAYSKNYIPKEIVEKSSVYYFKVLTNLCREYSNERPDRAVIREIYDSEMTKEVMKKVDSSIIPTYKKPEYFMMKHRLVLASSIYYYFKAKAN